MLVESLLHYWYYWTSVVAATLSLLLLGLAAGSLRQLKGQPIDPATKLRTSSSPVSIIVPAYNEQYIICQTVEALLSIEYPTYELIVVNDGSTDETLNVLRSALHLREIPQTDSGTLPHQPINRLFKSEVDPRIRVIDKCNGGKFDALNAGIAISRYPWFCCVDADTILMPNALSRIMLHIQTNASVVAIAGHIRVGNSCSKSRVLVMGQIVEYICSFAVERIGWNRLNGVVIVPGAFSLFNKCAVLEVGGYSSGMPTEDVELMIKLHRHNLYRNRTYKVLYVHSAVAWTEVPPDLPSLARQRHRWYRGLWTAFYHHRRMFFNPRYGRIGLLILPYLLLFDLLQPVLRTVVFAYLVISSPDSQRVIPLLVSLFLNFTAQFLISSVAILIDWRVFHRHHSYPHALHHILASILAERSIFTLLLAMFKTRALFAFIQSTAQGCGKWKTSTRMGFRLSLPEFSTLE